MSESQAVADEANPETQSSGEESGALEDVDSLLNEWESHADSATESSAEAEKQGEQSDDETKALLNELRQEREERIRQKTEQDVQQAVSSIKEGLETEVPDELIEGYLYREAAKDSRFLSAFQSRHKEPEKWNRLIKAMSGNLNKRMSSQVDQSVTDDRDAVASAVRSAQKAPAQAEGYSDKDLANMSDSEFNKLRRELGG